MHNELLRFWFEETDEKTLWSKDPAFDRLLAEKFSALHTQAVKCELFSWRRHALGRLAEIIVLDQLSRSLFRDTPAAFACDPQALALSQEAVAGGFAAGLTPRQKSFLYMPYMHSESPLIQQEGQALFEETGLAVTIDFAERHKVIIERFGRYPHRNKILGRTSTAEEIEFLKQPGSSF